MLLRHLAADVGDGALDGCSLGPRAFEGHANGPQQRVRQLERVAPRDVEAVEEPVADEIEVRRRGRARLSLERAQRLEDAAGLVVRLEQPLGGRILRDRGPQPLELGGGARRHGRRAAQQAEQLGRRESGPVADVREEVSRRDRRRAREAHVLEDHRDVVVAATRQVADELIVGQRVGIDRLKLPVGLDRSWA